ncbi:hypothetical protein [Streptomyces sp. NPDC006463]|uniref:hypothetical protein n=1 Tax=Streptomyces sp. NPDC006463 TaxID=3364746 RepID=UPI00368731D8
MTTSPPSAATDSSAQRRAVTPGTVIAALLVPLTTFGGVATSLRTEDIESAWAERQQEACRHMPFPTTGYVAAWAGLMLGVTAVVVCVLLSKRIPRRCGIRLGETWPGLIAYVGVWFNVLTIPIELIQLYAVYSVAGSGIVLGDCG